VVLVGSTFATDVVFFSFCIAFQDRLKPSASEMTYIVSDGALNSTHSLSRATESSSSGYAWGVLRWTEAGSELVDWHKVGRRPATVGPIMDTMAIGLQLWVSCFSVLSE